MATYTLDWSQTNLGGSAVVSYARGAVLDYSDKPAGATASLSCTRGLSSGDTNLAVFTIVTTGSSVLTFDYKTSTEAGWDKLHIDVDGVSQANYSGVIAWTTHAGISIPTAGTHTIRFRYSKDPGGVNADRVWIAKLQITNTTTVNDDASTVDTYNLEDGAIPPFVTTSTWTSSTSEPIAGSRSLRSPTSPANNGSYDMTVTKAAGSGYRAVGFDWKVSSESGWDKLFVYPDSTTGVPTHPTAPSEGSPGWLEWSGAASGRFAIILPSAASSFLLRYAKDGGGAAGSDAAWVDGFALPAAGGGTTPVTATRSTTWRARAAVTSTRATSWDVRTVATSTRATSWRVLTRPTATRAASWDVRTPVTAQRSTSWNVDGTITSVTATRATSWRTRAAVTATRSTTWRAAAAVTTLRTASWDTRAVVTTARSTSWDTRTPINATRSTTWDTTTAISRALATSWDVRTQVTAQRSSTWNVDSTLTAVTATRATSWRTLERPTTVRPTSWDVRATVLNMRATSWDVRTTVVGSRATAWDTLATAATTRPTSWRTLAPVTSARTTIWRTESDALPPKLSVGGAPLPARHRAGQPLPGRHTAGTPTAARYSTGGTP